MAPTPTPAMQTPHQKAIIGTTLVVILLVLFAFAGFWFGKQAKNTNTTTNTSTTNTEVNSSVSGAQKTAFSGKITKVLNDAIEVSTGSGENARVITTKIADATVFRKLDLRTIPKNGVGDGTPIVFSDFKVGNEVVIATADALNSTLTATKISMVIYP